MRRGGGRGPGEEPVLPAGGEGRRKSGGQRGPQAAGAEFWA